MSSQSAAPPKTDDHAFELDRVRLRFRDPKVESVFLSATLRSSVNFIRAYLIAGLLLYAAFAILDTVTQDPAMYWIFAIRFVIVCPFLIGIFTFTFFQQFYRFAQLALAGVMLIAGLGIVAMTAVIAPPFNSQYYAGVILVIV